MGWTRSAFDTNGRTVEIQHFTGSAQPYPWGNNSTPSGKVTTSYSGNTTTETDEAGVTRTTFVDGLGRIIEVFENGINAGTNYTYDALDNLQSVIPSVGLIRTYSYSSLNRLLYACNPEGSSSLSNPPIPCTAAAATTTYTYDANGNLATRTQGGLQTTFSYDEIDEVIGKTYTDSTPSVTYNYSKGWRTSVSSGNTTYQYTAFDGFGRVSASTQTTNSQVYTFPQYTYNLADSITSVTLPSGRVVTTTYNSAGQPYSVKSLLGAANPTYVTSASYWPHGGVNQLTLGNGITETTSYNARLQVSQVQAGGLLTIVNTYDASQSSCGAALPFNNGNLLNQTITRGSLQWSQTFTYDCVNRLSTGSESGEGAGWSETYGYDAVGNRYLASYSSSLPPPTAEVPQSPSWFLANNRINGWNYDPR